MDPVLLARIQFAMTIGFHYLFPPLTIGLAWGIFYFLTRALQSGEEVYQRQARFWFKLFAISFAIGVATGITMEFQFGTNWADYSRFVGDIFGAPLAAEGMFAFFLESTFMGVMLFGWKRFSRRVIWFSSLMVAFGSTLSAFWIIVANSWMQTPAGYEIVEGRAVLTDFWAALLNPSTLPRFLHTIDSALITGILFVMGISAWHLWKGQHTEFFKRSLHTAVVFGFVISLAQLPLGHYHAVQVANTQPAKLAAFEGLFETQRGAPLLLFGIPDAEAGEVKAAIRLPNMLSFLVHGDLHAEVPGLDTFPRDQWPPVGLSFFPFHLMFLLGMYFIAVTGLGLILLWFKKLHTNRFFLVLAFLTIPLPFLANQLGWWAAEVGRQPWIVYGIMRTADAVSPRVSAGQILFSILMFSVIYGLLFAVWVFLLRREIRKGPELPPPSQEGPAGRGPQGETAPEVQP
ncbi:MAG: cytochrome ubiquinol oxidase subunit I [Bradymonadales bacterium]|nr:cytochrome ubiquinol oxidase subunit I [Bradymonadales bacterium]